MNELFGRYEGRGSNGMASFTILSPLDDEKFESVCGTKGFTQTSSTTYPIQLLNTVRDVLIEQGYEKVEEVDLFTQRAEKSSGANLLDWLGGADVT